MAAVSGRLDTFRLGDPRTRSADGLAGALAPRFDGLGITEHTLRLRGDAALQWQELATIYNTWELSPDALARLRVDALRELSETADSKGVITTSIGVRIGVARRR